MLDFLDYINEAVQELDTLLATRPIDLLTPMSTITLTIVEDNESEQK